MRMGMIQTREHGRVLFSIHSGNFFRFQWSFTFPRQERGRLTWVAVVF